MVLEEQVKKKDERQVRACTSLSPHVVRGHRIPEVSWDGHGGPKGG